MRSWTATSSAPPASVWALLARPEAWARWAPYVSGAWGLGDPEVRQDAIGAARVFGVLPLPARITDVHPGRAWVWRLGALGVLEMVHRVEPRPGGGSLVAVDVLAPPPLDRLVALTYGGSIQSGLRRLAERAATEAAAAARAPGAAGAAGGPPGAAGAPEAARA